MKLKITIKLLNGEAYTFEVLRQDFAASGLIFRVGDETFEWIHVKEVSIKTIEIET